MTGVGWFAALTVGWVTWLVLGNRLARGRGPAAVVAAVLVAVPLAGLCLMVGLLLRLWLGIRRRRRGAAVQARQELELLARSLLVALSGGLSPVAALVRARRLLRSGLGEEVDQILRASVSCGLAAALMSASGEGGRLFRQLGAAHISGAPMIVTLTALANDLHESARAEAIQRARKLPVKMVVPLSLLMLPGFLLLMVGPTVLPSFERLIGPLAAP